DGFAEFFKTHHRQHGPEEFGEMRIASGPYAVLDAGRPEVWIAFNVLWHHGPFLAGIENLQRGFEITRRRADQRTHFGFKFPGGTHGETLRGFAQRAA